MNMIKLRYILSRLLLAVAYGAVVFEWLWVATIGLPPFIETGMFDALMLRTEQPVEAPVRSSGESSPLVIATVGAMTIVVLVVTIVIFLKLPRAILRGGEEVVNQTTRKVLPVVTHHKKLPEKKRRVISRRLRLLVQLLACLLPVMLSLFLPESDELSRNLVIIVTATLGSTAALAFISAWLLESVKNSTSRTRSRVSRG